MKKIYLQFLFWCLWGFFFTEDDVYIRIRSCDMIVNETTLDHLQITVTYRFQTINKTYTIHFNSCNNNSVLFLSIVTYITLSPANLNNRAATTYEENFAYLLGAPWFFPGIPRSSYSTVIGFLWYILCTVICFFLFFFLCCWPMSESQFSIFKFFCMHRY